MSNSLPRCFRRHNNLSISTDRHSVFVATILFASALASGCASAVAQTDTAQSTGDDTTVIASQSTQPVTLSFVGEFAGKPFDCNGEFINTGSSEAKVTVSEYKLFVSNVRMIAADGREVPVTLKDDGLWQQKDVALLDFENGADNCTNGTAQTNSDVIGRVASGEYTGVAFDIGVPFHLNHADPTLAAPPMNLTSMFWSWRGGYRFMRVDMAQTEMTGDVGMGLNHEKVHKEHVAQIKKSGAKMNDSSMKSSNSGHDMSAKGGKTHGAHHGGGRGWSLHIGSTGCAASTPTSIPTSCTSPNRIEVVLSDFDSATNVLVVDPANVLRGVDVTMNTPETSPGCMSSPDDPECALVFTRLGLKDSEGPQQLVRVR